MKRLLYIFILLAGLTACNSADETQERGKGTLELTLQRMNVMATGDMKTRSIDAGLSLTIIDKDNNIIVAEYAAGQAPDKIVLAEGTFTVKAFSDNQLTWQNDNEGRGSACYYAEKDVTIGHDEVVQCVMEVPMTNYAVGLTLPEQFAIHFKTYTFSLASGSRTVAIKSGEKAYFDTQEGGFAYTLTATNTDDKTNAAPTVRYTEIEEGKLFNIRYSYDSNATSGGVDIEITDNMETEDNNISL